MSEALKLKPSVERKVYFGVSSQILELILTLLSHRERYRDILASAKTASLKHHVDAGSKLLHKDLPKGYSYFDLFGAI